MEMYKMYMYNQIWKLSTVEVIAEFVIEFYNLWIFFVSTIQK